MREKAILQKLGSPWPKEQGEEKKTEKTEKGLASKRERTKGKRRRSGAGNFAKT